MSGVVREVRMICSITIISGIIIAVARRRSTGARIMFRTWMGTKMKMRATVLRRRGEVGLGRCWIGFERWVSSYCVDRVE
jgi:hypothetical protein